MTREMQEALVDLRATRANFSAEKRRLTANLGRHDRAIVDWQNKAEMAISKGRDDLAKAALRERSHHESEKVNLEQTILQLDTDVEKINHDTAVLEDKLEYAKVRRDALVLRGRAVKSRIRVKRQLESHDVD